MRALLPHRRFKRLHERVLLSHPVAFALGWIASVGLPSLFYWNWQALVHPNVGQRTALIATTIAFSVSYLAAKNLLGRFPGGRTQGLISTQVFTVYALVIIATLLLRMQVSRALLLGSGFAALLWFQIDYLITRSYMRPKLAVIGGGFADWILELTHVDSRQLHTLDLEGIRYDGVVADFQTINADEERFLTRCALDNVPVYHAKNAFESLTGRVKIDDMVENTIGSLLPSPGYLFVKTIMDWVIVVLTLPISLPIAAVTALLIRLESPGPVLYTQTRVGKGNRLFTIYKFRSMRFDRPAGARFAKNDDPRITRVGHIIRKLRIDELPQFINVLKGEMSLIGPRPEQPSFVEAFDEQIPFYSYRHVVKPGITGWAQVKHGYADDKDSTSIKIEHDFYYIKHCSLTMDFFIVVLTLKTILSGFGAR